MYWNHGAARLYGWSSEEAVGAYIHYFLQTVFPKPLQEVRKEFLATGFWTGELRHRTRNGHMIIVSSRWTLLRDLTGTPTGSLELNTDITERKGASRNLRREISCSLTLRPPLRHGGAQGRADQEAETEDRGSRPGQRHLTGGLETVPFGPEDIRRVRAERSGVSERRSCRVLGSSRARLHRHGTAAGRRRGRTRHGPSCSGAVDSAASHIRISAGSGRCCGAKKGLVVNRKAVYRVLQQKRWLVHQRS